MADDFATDPATGAAMSRAALERRTRKGPFIAAYDPDGAPVACTVTFVWGEVDRSEFGLPAVEDSDEDKIAAFLVENFGGYGDLIPRIDDRDAARLARELLDLLNDG